MCQLAMSHQQGPSEVKIAREFFICNKVCGSLSMWEPVAQVLIGAQHQEAVLFSVNRSLELYRVETEV